MPRCEKCDKSFGSEGALHQHNVSKHPQLLESVKNKNSSKRNTSGAKSKRLGKKVKQKIILIGVLAIIVLAVSWVALALSNDHHQDSVGGVGIKRWGRCSKHTSLFDKWKHSNS